MILIGLGANLSSPVGGPMDTCLAALAAFPAEGITVWAVSHWYRSAPQPVSEQPWFINGVALVTSSLSAADLLARLHRVEERFGRIRSVANAARSLDLDLLAYGAEVHAGAITVPHPRMHERAFVLAPLADLAPAWRHPILGKTAAELLAALPSDQGLERVSTHDS
ncbi:MAG: 2-amino-4-hydroxy-6-hydroxymethyldihydropteridine diphosphokinase [Rhodospirillaceae bacterium]|nr:MAG: 2-amino-4-hydroxy-6-hydroxymethyldihydropteridine diphosphokinase [Rhodospirillaceae bacterium]